MVTCPPRIFGERHAVVAAGWKADKLHITNSWGKTWGENGTGWLTMTDIEEAWGLEFMATTKFKDVDDTRWSAPYINKLADLGIINGYEDGTFRPQNTITREEAAKLICLAIEKVNP